MDAVRFDEWPWPAAPPVVEAAPPPVESVAAGRWWRDLLPLVGIVALALLMYSWGLSRAGYGNTYYAAAVRSMTVSWKNFFFGAFDPGGFITVDKPPVALWVGALSARVFGYSTWSILLPSAAAGAGAVAVLWYSMRRYFGVVAATVAGLVLALTPISVAVNRLNLPEPFMLLALIGAAAMVLRSGSRGPGGFGGSWTTEGRPDPPMTTRRWWAWLIGAGALVGVAFNTKMLAAWIPGPALALGAVLVVKGALRTTWRTRLARLAVLGAVTLAASLWWGLAVDLIPPPSRPSLGGSTNNSELNLAVGYNGFGRVDGQG